LDCLDVGLMDLRVCLQLGHTLQPPGSP
jgi:hypothetical protein